MYSTDGEVTQNKLCTVDDGFKAKNRNLESKNFMEKCQDIEYHNTEHPACKALKRFLLNSCEQTLATL